MDVRLPKTKESKAKGLYERSGNVNISSNGGDFDLPISMDAEAMNALLQELVMKQAREEMEASLPPIESLPGPQF